MCVCVLGYEGAKGVTVSTCLVEFNWSHFVSLTLSYAPFCYSKSLFIHWLSPRLILLSFSCPFFSLSLLCSVDPQHFVLRQIQLPAHGTAAHGYLSDSVLYSHGTSLSHSLAHSPLSNLLSTPPLMALWARMCISPVFHPFSPFSFLSFFFSLSLSSAGRLRRSMLLTHCALEQNGHH